MINKLAQIQFNLAKEVKDMPFRRYLFSSINWDCRLIGIVGARGTGKTTMLLQYYLLRFKTPEDCLYLSADNINVSDKGLFALAEEFFSLGGQVILIDEVQKYPDWQREIKNIYDSFPGKKIVFSGSSSVQILKGKADLSRRVVLYQLKGLSYREYLCLRTGKTFKKFALDEVLTDHVRLAGGFDSRTPVLRYFKDYLKSGYYPFFKEGEDVFFNKLNNVIEKIFNEDIPFLFNIKPATIHSLKRFFYLVATSQPFVPNISRISSQLGISKEYIYAYIDEMEKAGLFMLLHSKNQGLRLLRKPQKIYLENSNLFSLVEESRGLSIEQGSIRETFFLNQVSAVNKLFYGEDCDFTDSLGRLYEVGGKDKEPVGKGPFIISDGIEVGFKNKIPLWLFGFLY